MAVVEIKNSQFSNFSGAHNLRGPSHDFYFTKLINFLAKLNV